MMKIECVIFDWAGTTVDYGCFAPVAAFVSAFKDLGIKLTIEEARGPMGMTKIDHIRVLFSLESISSQFTAITGREWCEDDVVKMNECFESYLFASLAEYTDAIPFAFEAVDKLRAAGIKIGSTTGYTAKMMDVVAPAAAAKGYSPDCYVTSDGLPAGRPKPFMIYQNMINLGVESPRTIIKVGDTAADIKEGVNSSVWSVGVVTGSSEMALSQREADSMNHDELEARKAAVRSKFLKWGADYVIDTLGELPTLVDMINSQLSYKN